MRLREATELAAHLVGGKQTLPILSHVMISGGRVQACDASQQIDIPLDLPEGLKKAKFCVHGGRFLRVLAALPKDVEIAFKHGKNELEISAGPTTYVLNTLSAEDYPQMKRGEGEAVAFSVPSKPFVAALRFAAIAMAKNDIRYYLNGVHFALKSKRLTLTGTDGHRLHRAQVEVEEADAKDKCDGILAAAAIERVIEVAERHVAVLFAATAVRVELGKAAADGKAIIDSEQFLSTLLDGKYPDVERVIPKERTSAGAALREPLAAAVRRVGVVMAGTKLPGVTVNVAPDHILLQARNPEGERAIERFEWNAADRNVASEFTVPFEQLAQALEGLTGEHAFLFMPTDEKASLYITGGDSCEAVVMQMRV
jgi:DNA polymerase-3 subunit beta